MTWTRAQLQMTNSTFGNVKMMMNFSCENLLEHNIIYTRDHQNRQFYKAITLTSCSMILFFFKWYLKLIILKEQIKYQNTKT